MAMPITPEIACKHLISVASAWSRWKHVNPRLTKIDDPGSDSDRIDVLQTLVYADTIPVPGRPSIHTRNTRLCISARYYTYTDVHKLEDGEDERGPSPGRRGRATRRNHRWLPFITPRSKHGPESGPLGWLTRNDDSPRCAGPRAATTRDEEPYRRVCVCVCVCVCESTKARARTNVRLAEIDQGHANHSFSPRLRGRSLRGSGRFSGREVNDCLVMPPEMADN